MLRVIRYALAALCLTASGGCLGLWWRSYTWRDDLISPNNVPSGHVVMVYVHTGRVVASLHQHAASYKLGWQCFSGPALWYEPEPNMTGNFGRVIGTKAKQVYFPVWYAALVLACAAVAALRIGRFTLRSALVGVTVVALLLGMAVAL